MMQQGALLLFIIAPIALGASAPTARGHLDYAEGSGSDIAFPGPQHAFPDPQDGLQSLEARKPTTGHLRNRHAVAALQASQSTRLQMKASSGKEKRGRSAKKAKSLLQRLTRVQSRMTHGLKKMFKMQVHKRRVKTQKQTEKVGLCRTNKLRWWIIIKKKCVKAYGKDSKWDRDKLDGKCAQAWNDCSTGFYAVCCSQPIGAKSMEAYCANQALIVVNASDAKKNGKDDKACQIQNKMRGVQNSMSAIKDTIGLLGVSTAILYGPGPSPAPSGIPAGLLPIAYAGPAPAPAPTALLDRCAKLTELTRQAAEKIAAIKLWAKHGRSNNQESQPKAKEVSTATISKVSRDGVDNDEATDPDLVFSVKGVLGAGEKLDAILKNPSFCNTGEDDDDDDDDSESDIEDDSSINETAINETAIMELLNWEGDMTNAVDKFEKDVHPHGFKWWRYRYEYTIIESLVLTVSVMLMYFVMWLLHGVSFFQYAKFYKTGRPDSLLRYAWAYFVFHSATLMVMVTVAYMLYIPWGKQNIFDICAEGFHNFVDGRANVPFLGYSWLYMVLDVQFQLFVCFALYALFIVFVVRNNQKALEDWKLLSENAEHPSVSPANAELWRSFESIMRKRVENSPEYRQMLHELKLRFPGVAGFAGAHEDSSEFKLHLYLTDALGKSVEYLVEVSLTTNIFLACSALVVALLAHHFQVAFMYFLPGFLVLGVALFIAGVGVARHFRALSNNDDHNTPTTWAKPRAYCRAIQIMLYCILFSFSRLLLSNDIFEFYPRVYISAVVGLVIVLGLLALVAGEVIKETSCALILPPHVAPDQFKLHLEQIVHWHTTQKCHECGVQQLPAHCSFSREWAGNTPIGERKEVSSAVSPDSGRLFSWRG